MRIGRLPQDDDANGWNRILPRRQATPALQSRVSSDWLIIGAGYAGLAAARRLARNRPQDSIAIIEAGEVGENASGRNSGFAIDLPHNVGSSLAELEGSQRFMRLARSAIDHLDEAVKTHDIKCDWRRAGKYHAAVSRRGIRDVLEPLAKELDALCEPYKWIEKSTLKEKLGSNHFAAAIYTPGCVLMNPAALTRGLADHLPGTVTLFENSPVLEVDYNNEVLVRTAKGSAYAPRVIITVNGFIERFGFLRGNLLHLVAHASLTRQLNDEERRQYGVNKSWGLTPVNAFVGATMRYTDDHRILIRHGLNYCPSQRVSKAERRAVAIRHKTLLDQRFPALSSVNIEHTWSGFVCLSSNGAPGFGQCLPNVWMAVCQNAVGVTKGTISGILAADLASDCRNPLIEDMRSLGSPAKLPPRPFLDLGVRSRFLWESWAHRHEA